MRPLFAIALLGVLVSNSSGNSDLASDQRFAFTDAANFGFSPSATGLENAKALQRAVEESGTVVVSQVGTYHIANTVYLPSNTTLIFGNNVFLKKTAEPRPFSHVLINKGAANRAWDSHISVKGLQLIVNKVDVCDFNEAFGLNGQLSFFYTKDVRIEGFRCLDLGKEQVAIQICNFEDVFIGDLIIKGLQEGIHLGRGKRFTIRNGIFDTFNQAIALNAQDEISSTPELGWIENGVVENCHDLEANKAGRFFCGILAGSWLDWKTGMEVQRSDTIISNNRLYRVDANPDGSTFKSYTAPSHQKGVVKLDGINWRLVQSDVQYSAGVRNIVFKDIFLNKPRVGFAIHFDNNNFNRSYYPKSQAPLQEGIALENVQVLNTKNTNSILSVNTPVDVISVRNSRLHNNSIEFFGDTALEDYGKSFINLAGSTFCYSELMDVVVNKASPKDVYLKTTASITLPHEFQARVRGEPGQVFVDSDLPGLRK